MQGSAVMQRYAVLAMLLILGAIPAAAQSRGFRASVPFDFSIGRQVLPAGTYQFQRPLGQPSSDGEVGMIAVRQVDGLAYSAVVTSLAQAGKPSLSKNQPDTRLVFKKRAGQWQLFQVWIRGDARGQQLRGAGPGTDAIVAVDEPEVAIAELR